MKSAFGIHPAKLRSRLADSGGAVIYSQNVRQPPSGGRLRKAEPRRRRRCPEPQKSSGHFRSSEKAADLEINDWPAWWGLASGRLRLCEVARCGGHGGGWDAFSAAFRPNVKKIFKFFSHSKLGSVELQRFLLILNGFYWFLMVLIGARKGGRKNRENRPPQKPPISNFGFGLTLRHGNHITAQNRSPRPEKSGQIAPPDCPYFTFWRWRRVAV